MSRSNSNHSLGVKDLARTMGLHPRSIKRWWLRLKIPPTVPGYACHRWSQPDAERLLRAWKSYQKQKSKLFNHQ